uniref:Ig-like domain-containing protein n=1 Tax=Xenopus tropicalis TaxID=8364 RepID=A0A6I8QFM3_XENTR
MVMHKLYYVPVGAAVRPVVSFSPNWTPIFPGESVTLSCNVAPTAQGNLGYSWYRDGHQISGDQQSFVIHSSTSSDIGNYQCQVGANERSNSVRLNFKTDWVILQAPPAVYEGDSLSLRCHSRKVWKDLNGYRRIFEVYIYINWGNVKDFNRKNGLFLRTNKKVILTSSSFSKSITAGRKEGFAYTEGFSDDKWVILLVPIGSSS